MVDAPALPPPIPVGTPAGYCMTCRADGGRFPILLIVDSPPEVVFMPVPTNWTASETKANTPTKTPPIAQGLTWDWWSVELLAIRREAHSHLFM